MLCKIEFPTANVRKSNHNSITHWPSKTDCQIAIESTARIYKATVRPAPEINILQKISGKTLLHRKRNEHIRNSCKHERSEQMNRMEEERTVRAEEGVPENQEGHGVTTPRSQKIRQGDEKNQAKF